MSSLSNTVLGVLAACTFNADAVAPGFVWARGFAAGGFVRNGAGDYTLTLSEGVSDASQGSAFVTARGATPASCSVEFLTTTTLRVRTVNPLGETPATDLDFYLEVHEVGPA